MTNTNESPNGIVVTLLTAAAKGEPMTACQSIMATEKGLADDRYTKGAGYYSGNPTWDAPVTLIAAEAIEAANEEHGGDYTAEMLRRNIVTRGFDVKSLLGRRFQIGEAVLQGTKEWPPCNYVSKMNDCPELLKHFAHSGGIGANVVTPGAISVGDDIVVLPD